MILRLIDIVLILFFGFICIATIDMTGQMQLPSSPNADKYPTLENMQVVSVDRNGNIRLGSDRRTIDYNEFTQLLDREISRTKAEDDKKANLSIKVRVDRRSPMSAIKTIIRICNGRNTKCSIEVLQDIQS